MKNTMNKYKLTKLVSPRQKRVGRGYGSGKGGHTTGRGQKGQKSRTNIGIIFEGYKVKKSMIKRLPLRRGRGKFKAHLKPIVVDISLLNLLPDGSVVDAKSLVSNKIVKSDDLLKYGVKILGKGKLEKKLKIAVSISRSAAEVVKKAGGEIMISKK